MFAHPLWVEFRERNAVVAQKWAALTETSRKEWAVKAEAACSAAIQVRCWWWWDEGFDVPLLLQEEFNFYGLQLKAHTHALSLSL